MNQLSENTVVDFFKSEMRSMPFILAADHIDIEKRLDILADNRKKRFRKVEAAAWLWKRITGRALSFITDNTRGFDALCQYFDEYMVYEDLLFAIDENHRDHTVHSIWVMLIGTYLRKYYSPFRKINYSGDVPNLYEGYRNVAKNIKRTVEIIQKREDALWCLTALTHDLGYPIQKTMNANRVMAKMISNFGFLELEDFKYGFTVVHQAGIDALLDIISSGVIWKPSGGYEFRYAKGTRLDSAKCFERLEHGIMSAYLWQEYMDYICDLLNLVDNVPGVEIKNPEEAANRAMLSVMLSSIAAHSNRNQYYSSFDNIGVLLFLADELDEFSRFARSRLTNEWSQVGCKIKLELTKHSLWVIHEFDNKNISDDMEYFFKAKVQKLHDRINLTDSQITKVYLKCEDLRMTPNISFIYEKSLHGLPNGRIRKNHGKDTVDVRGYLDGTIKL